LEEKLNLPKGYIKCFEMKFDRHEAKKKLQGPGKSCKGESGFGATIEDPKL